MDLFFNGGGGGEVLNSNFSILYEEHMHDSYVEVINSCCLQSIPVIFCHSRAG